MAIQTGNDAPSISTRVEELRLTRTRLRLSQRFVNQECGWPINRLYKIEAGIIKPRLEAVEQLETTLMQLAQRRLEGTSTE